MVELREMRDRELALVAGALLDTSLETALRLHFVQVSSRVHDRLWESPGVLADLGAKIDIARASGLIGQAAHARMHLIRKVRNEFAHSIEPLTMDDGKQARFVDDLIRRGFDADMSTADVAATYEIEHGLRFYDMDFYPDEIEDQITDNRGVFGFMVPKIPGRDTVRNAAFQQVAMQCVASAVAPVLHLWIDRSDFSAELHEGAYPFDEFVTSSRTRPTSAATDQEASTDPS
ncbi:DUF4145 domain-containing protein [Pseudoclavibacter sp. 8L]|uniref:DUF4145 domain-containing protein n=1 Tax=Pseudoclavibacter sp. 8L TaxID=2653162 RepID=UPI0013588ACD|nr:DUF4145 domain-containing protein [Pseudoclavibacter sp. 8L]